MNSTENVYWPPRVNTKSRAMKAQKFQHGKTRPSVRRRQRTRGTNGWEGDGRCKEGASETEKDNRWRERRKREKEIITRSVFSHLHSIPDGWAKSQLHFCALVKQGYYLNNSLLSKGKRREALSRPGLLYITRIPRPLVCDTIPKLEVETSSWN